MSRAYFFQQANFIPRIIDRLILPWVSWLRVKGVIGQTSVPSLTISEEKERYRITVAAPGFQNKDLFFKANHKKLFIRIFDQGPDSTQTEQAAEASEQNRFACSIRLPPEVRQHMIDAHLEHGLLFILLPKGFQKPDRKATSFSIYKQ
ncbi:Hsp20/alpha crystallin family protein [Niabella drilacis]|uniref:Hsp20/alpha crystallin family protein n=1 Tax=Niabella drilacis (strain DSM 25811 / CCM 8410 / CCUG 62505 / LMG 26954 / E90) TaxID=1285928 RepID=A0A1G6REV3_NIADE|nr:Hsp20/alpha crystallin family protein [Niabella drilacis]SDD02575.1 Hsp20/alpha crystallin family protein [Niabella drilacis]